MVHRILEQEEAIRIVFGADRKTSHLVPTWQDIEVLQPVDSALSPLCYLTDILSGEQYVTFSAVLPLLSLIENDILKASASETLLTKDLKMKIKEDLLNRYTTTHLTEKAIMILKKSSFLDPRFKTKYMTDHDVFDVESELLLECSMPNVTPPRLPTSSEGMVCMDPHPPTQKKRNLGALFKGLEKDSAEHEEEADVSLAQKFQEKVQQYITVSRLDFEEDPLLWWKLYSLSYPILSHLAAKYLSVCATSTSSEHLFSTSCNIVTPNGSHLTPDKVEILTFLSKNLD